MKKLSTVLIIILVVLSFVSGYFLYQISHLERKNSDLRNRNTNLEEQIFELEGRILELENTITELQTQKNELQEQIDELQKIINTPKAKFVDFSSPTGWFNPVGVTMAIRFDVTIVNVGLNDIEGVIVEISWNNSEGDTFNRTRNLDTLESGEIVEFHEDLIISMDTYFAEFYHTNFIATISSDDTILDESILEITERQF